MVAGPAAGESPGACMEDATGGLAFSKGDAEAGMSLGDAVGAIEGDAEGAEYKGVAGFSPASALAASAAVE
jgi:hypothetical protein